MMVLAQIKVSEHLPPKTGAIRAEMLRRTRDRGHYVYLQGAGSTRWSGAVATLTRVTMVPSLRKLWRLMGHSPYSGGYPLDARSTNRSAALVRRKSRAYRSAFISCGDL